MEPVVVFVVVAGIVAVAWWARTQAGSSESGSRIESVSIQELLDGPGAPASRSVASTEDWKRTLVRMAAGDSAKADRLIAARRARDPSLSEAEAARLEVEDWRQDHRP